MKFEFPRNRHIDAVMELASADQRILDALQSRPHLLNPYPSIGKRLEKRSRKYRLQMAGRRETRAAAVTHGAPPRLRLVGGGSAA